jgi:hypothetical protein
VKNNFKKTTLVNGFTNKKKRSESKGTHSLPFSKFNVNFNSKLTAMGHDTLQVTPKMVEPSMNRTPQLTVLICKKIRIMV